MGFLERGFEESEFDWVSLLLAQWKNKGHWMKKSLVTSLRQSPKRTKIINHQVQNAMA